ncbi:CAP domain-containing protein [Ornithinibacillus sp. FSL M8-0202]|uniref:CAP domain-containing protein n=1 Tax=unclassified Ornithinibacillus TaxID=2620869 RepID=UPI0030CD25C0
MKGSLVKLSIGILMMFVLAACNTDNANNENHENPNISSISTDQSSSEYPHTQPIKTQDAKYEAREAPQQNQQPERGQEQRQQGQQAPQQQTTENHGLSKFESDVVALTNRERRQAGLNALEVDTSLSQVARQKSTDMQQQNYFSHTSPTYGSPFDMMRDFGITYRSAGENIAKGQTSPEEVVQAWMNSQGHRENILNANFTHIGVGYEQNGNHWTQMFITK